MESKTLTFRPSKANPDLLKNLSELAKKDNRTLNNYIELILLKWVKKAL